MMMVEFQYALGQEVSIGAVGLKGRVDSVSAHHDSKQYRVVYWFNGLRYQTWVYGWEIEAAAKEPPR